METIQFQKNKLELIEQIIHCENTETIEAMKSLIDGGNEYELSEEQLLIIKESRQQYLSGDDEGKSWNEVKTNLHNKRYEKL